MLRARYGAGKGVRVRRRRQEKTQLDSREWWPRLCFWGGHARAAYVQYRAAWQFVFATSWRQVARPAPVLGAGHQLRPQCVALDIAYHRIEIVVGFDWKRLEAPLVNGKRAPFRRYDNGSASAWYVYA